MVLIVNLSKAAIPLDAEVIEVVSDMGTEDEPLKDFDSYLYNVKYSFYGREMISPEPIESTQIAKIGETIKILVCGDNGSIYLDNSFDIRSILNVGLQMIIWMLIFKSIFVALRKSINIVLDEGVRSLLFAIKRFLFYFAAQILLIGLVFSARDLIDLAPKYFNGDYIRISGIITEVENSIPEDGEIINRWYLKYNYKDHWFAPNTRFYSTTNSYEVGDSKNVLIDKNTGALADEQIFGETFTPLFENVIICLVGNVVLKLIATHRWKKKEKKINIDKEPIDALNNLNPFIKEEIQTNESMIDCIIDNDVDDVNDIKDTDVFEDK